MMGTTCYMGRYKGEIFWFVNSIHVPCDITTEILEKAKKFNMKWEDVRGKWILDLPCTDVEPIYIDNKDKWKYRPRFFVKYKDDWFKVWGETETQYKIVSCSERMIIKYDMLWDDKWEGRENDHERGYLWVKKDEVLPVDKAPSGTVCQRRDSNTKIYNILDRKEEKVLILLKERPHLICRYDWKNKIYYLDEKKLKNKIQILTNDFNTSPEEIKVFEKDNWKAYVSWKGERPEYNSETIKNFDKLNFEVWVPREKLFIFGEDKGIIRL